MERQTLIFLGTQGSGKGTQLELLKNFLAAQNPERRVVHFEMGKNLRLLAQKNNYTGRKSARILAGGNLIPFAVSTSVFADYLIDHMETGEEHLLIDGFPRTVDQIPNIDSAMEFYERKNPTVLFLTISDDTAVGRLRKRGREDDTEEGIRARLRWSREEAAPCLDWFRSNSKYHFIEVNGERTVEEIHADILHTLGLQP